MSNAMSTISAVNAQQAALSARQAKEAACSAFVESFKGSADVAVRQQYADCVQLLHSTGESSIFLKVLFAMILIGVIFSVITSILNKDNADEVIAYAIIMALAMIVLFSFGCMTLYIFS